MIGIYKDVGSGEESLIETYNTFKTFSSEKVIYISTYDILENDILKDLKLLIIPGGRDLPYCEKLNGKGVKLIKNFVNTGGSYLGICAGAYFACNKVIFDEGGELEVIGDRELKLIDTEAIGPAFGAGTYKYNSDFGQKLLKVDNFYAYFNGGCYFKDPKADIISFYDGLEKKPSIIFSKYGKGKVLLTGIHFEFSKESILNKKFSTKEKNNFIKSLLNREMFIKKVLLKLNVLRIK